MKKILLASVVASSLLLAANTQNFDPKSAKEHLVVKMQILDQKKNKDAGEVVAVQTPYGVAFFPNLKGLEAGIHGFHIHENADCGKTDKGLGMKAGGHWDPEKTTNHSLPWDDEGHKGDFAGRLIEAVGLKGFVKGGAMISDKHANFLINTKNASFEDAIYLIELAEKKVFEEFGINLEREVVVI